MVLFHCRAQKADIKVLVLDAPKVLSLHLDNQCWSKFILSHMEYLGLMDAQKASKYSDKVQVNVTVDRNQALTTCQSNASFSTKQSQKSELKFVNIEVERQCSELNSTHQTVTENSSMTLGERNVAQTSGTNLTMSKPREISYQNENTAVAQHINHHSNGILMSCKSIPRTSFEESLKDRDFESVRTLPEDVIVVLNKSDLLSRDELQNLPGRAKLGSEVCNISCLVQGNLEPFLQALTKRVKTL